MKSLLSLFLIVTLSACVPQVQHPTPSRKVEATINGVTRDAVKNRLIDEMVNKGYTITKSDDAMISFDAPMEDPNVVVLFGKPEAKYYTRINFNLVQYKKAVRVIADVAVVTNRGSGFEHASDINHVPDTLKIQSWLNNVKYSME